MIRRKPLSDRLLKLALALGCWGGLPLPAHAHAASFQGDAQLLVDEADAWGAIRAMVKGARHSVLVDEFILAGDKGLALANLLLERHREGVAVQVMLDPHLKNFPPLHAGEQQVLETLRAGGIPVRFYPVELLAWHTGHRSALDHNKAIVVDDDRAVVGSFNFLGSGLRCHDLSVWITGRAVASLARELRGAFDQAASLGPEMVQPATQAPFEPPIGDARISYAPTGFYEASARPLVLETLAGARKSIEVMLFHLEDPAATQALVEAARRGVTVRVLLDPGHLGPLAPAGVAPEGLLNLAAARRLAEAGAQVRWYKPRAGELALHAKAALVDRQTVLIGSTNWSRDGFEVNHESLLRIERSPAAQDFAAVFARDWASNSTAVSFLPRPLVDAQIWLYRGLARLFG